MGHTTKLNSEERGDGRRGELMTQEHGEQTPPPAEMLRLLSSSLLLLRGHAGRVCTGERATGALGFGLGFGSGGLLRIGRTLSSKAGRSGGLRRLGPIYVWANYSGLIQFKLILELSRAY